MQALFQYIWHGAIKGEGRIEQIFQEVDVRLKVDAALDVEWVELQAIQLWFAQSINRYGVSPFGQSDVSVLFFRRFYHHKRFIAGSQNALDGSSFTTACNTTDKGVLIEVCFAQSKFHILQRPMPIGNITNDDAIRRGTNHRIDYAPLHLKVWNSFSGRRTDHTQL